MNAQQRKALAALVESLKAFEFPSVEDLEKIKEDVSDMAEAEDEKFNNLSEGLQQAERGQALETARDALNEAAEKIQEVIDAIESLDDLRDDAVAALESVE